MREAVRIGVAALVWLVLSAGLARAQPGFSAKFQVFNEGSQLANASGVNFIGSAIDCVVTPPLTRADCTITGGGVEVSTDDVTVVSGATRLEFPSGSFAVTNPSGTVASVDLATTVTKHGAVVGDAVGEVVAYDGNTTDQTCGGGNEGRFRVLDDGTWQFCSGSTSSTVYEPLIATGISGGQTAYGGTATTDTLTLNPSTASDARGAVNVCASNPNIGNNTTACLKPFSGGLSLGLGSSNTFGAVVVDSTITQTTNGDLFGFPAGFLFSDRRTQQITDSALNPGTGYMGASYTIDARPTMKNNTDDNYSIGVGLGALGMYWNPSYVKGSTGTLTNPVEAAIWSAPATIPSGVTVTSQYGGAHTSPTATGTLTDAYGWYASVGSGTNQHPFAAAEKTVTGSTKSNEVDWGAESGSPGRFWVRNESGHIWRMGYTSWTATFGALAADNTTRYAQPIGTAVAWDTTEANVDTFVAPGALKVYAIACSVGVAPDNGAGTQTRTFTVRSGAIGSLSDSSLACTGISETTKVCTGRVEAGVAVTAGQVITIKATAASTPAATTASEATCTLWWNLDAF